MTPEPARVDLFREDDTLATTARACHPACIACRGRRAGGLGLRFAACGEDRVRAEFLCDDRYQGYPDRLHGGVVAVLLDAAMTHCLFARGLPGVTARLDIRYREPVEFGVHGTVSARFLRRRGRLCLLTAEVEQHGVVCAEASASFVVLGQAFAVPGARPGVPGRDSTVSSTGKGDVG